MLPRFDAARAKEAKAGCLVQQASCNDKQQVARTQAQFCMCATLASLPASFGHDDADSVLRSVVWGETTSAARSSRPTGTACSAAPPAAPGALTSPFS